MERIFIVAFYDFIAENYKNFGKDIPFAIIDKIQRIIRKMNVENAASVVWCLFPERYKLNKDDCEYITPKRIADEIRFKVLNMI